MPSHKTPSLPKQPLLVGVVQMCSTDQVEANVELALKSMRALQGCDLICLPENAFYLRFNNENKENKEAAPTFDLTEPFWRQLRELAKMQKAHILVGSIPFNQNGRLIDGQKSSRLPANSTIWITSDGEVSRVYDKIHLFDVDVEGAPPARESDSFAPGRSPQIIEINGWRIGLSICYDVRFAELYSWYARRDVHLITVPSSFLVPTGQAHWHTLLRARAIESQTFVVAAAQSGGHQNASGQRRETFGHSLVVDPWGVILADIEAHGQAEMAVELEPSQLRKVRSQIPQFSHRRLCLDGDTSDD